MTTTTMVRTGFAVTTTEGRLVVVLAGTDAKHAADEWAERGYRVEQITL